ncbi:LysR family transcriptional regulator [Kordiimonas sp. SCSIO 12610]|uniref:LysR family transcriptional regulator n=1 Tax=Kordiimonas sp. SCSIO 12610 TaxID=2829597 RepID=UPI00210DB25B|nr:LysR family transcriptional regulator [Kordiimonas sp. SCSIO 12610]UTW56282.1 LysR family transcriptional regulator [Kordiimonas sp. SCSIO 12610]
MDQLSAMRVFVVVAELGGFSAAARQLNLPLSTVSRKVAELEAHLGAQLLTRTTRKLSLTESGERFLAACRRILDDLTEAEQAASDEYTKPTGTLSITAPVFFGRLHILPIVHEFLNAYPDVKIKLSFADHVVDLLDQHIDLGIRIGQLADSSMIAKQMGTVRRIICASPDYLRENGTPHAPEDLAHHQCISIVNNTSLLGWRFAIDGRDQYYPINSRLQVTSTEAAVDSAVHHMGLTQVLSYQAADQIKAGRLSLVLNEFLKPLIPVHFIYPQGRLVPVKLRTFIDFATPLLKARLGRVATDCGLNE